MGATFCKNGHRRAPAADSRAAQLALTSSDCKSALPGFNAVLAHLHGGAAGDPLTMGCSNLGGIFGLAQTSGAFARTDDLAVRVTALEGDQSSSANLKAILDRLDNENGRQRTVTHGTSKRPLTKAAKAAAAIAELEAGDINTMEMVTVSIPKKKSPNPLSPTPATTTTTTTTITTMTKAKNNPSIASLPPPDDLYGPVASNYVNLFARVVPIVCELYADVVANPLAALSTIASPTSLKAALDAAAVHCGNLDSVLRIATAFAVQFDQSTLAAAPAAAPSRIHAAVINAYTQESPLYREMNAALGGYGPDGRAPLKHYLPLVKLLDDAMKPLRPLAAPDGGPATLYRGVKMPASALLGGLRIGDTLTWYSFVSTTTDPDVLRSKDFLGIGKEGAAAVQGAGLYEMPMGLNAIYEPIDTYMVPVAGGGAGGAGFSAAEYAEPASMSHASSVGAEEHVAINMVPGSASSVVYATPAEGYGRRKTAVRCARPAPSGGTCKNVPSAGCQFCHAHTCPVCGKAKSSSAKGCPQHPAGLETATPAAAAAAAAATRAGPQHGKSIYEGFGSHDNLQEDC
eukprot:gene7638-16976_t